MLMFLPPNKCEDFKDTACVVFSLPQSDGSLNKNKPKSPHIHEQLCRLSIKE